MRWLVSGGVPYSTAGSEMKAPGCSNASHTLMSVSQVSCTQALYEKYWPAAKSRQATALAHSKYSR